MHTVQASRRGRRAHLNNGGSTGGLHAISTRRETANVAPGIEIDGRRHMPLPFSCSMQLAPSAQRPAQRQSSHPPPALPPPGVGGQLLG